MMFETGTLVEHTPTGRSGTVRQNIIQVDEPTEYNVEVGFGRDGKEWVRSVDLVEWRDRKHASAQEVVDLLDEVYNLRGALAGAILAMEGSLKYKSLPATPRRLYLDLLPLFRSAVTDGTTVPNRKRWLKQADLPDVLTRAGFREAMSRRRKSA